MATTSDQTQQTPEQQKQQLLEEENKKLRDTNSKLAEQALSALENVGRNTEPVVDKEPPVEIHPDDEKKLNSYFEKRLGPIANAHQANWEEYARDRAKGAAPKALVANFWPEVEAVMKSTNAEARASLAMWMEAVNIVTGRHFNELTATAAADQIAAAESETGASAGGSGPSKKGGKNVLEGKEKEMADLFGMTADEYIAYGQGIPSGKGA